MAKSIVDIRVSDLPEFMQVLRAHGEFVDAASPLFDSHGPITGSPEWQSQWEKASDALSSLMKIKDAFPRESLPATESQPAQLVGPFWW